MNQLAKAWPRPTIYTKKVCISRMVRYLKISLKFKSQEVTWYVIIYGKQSCQPEKDKNNPITFWTHEIYLITY